MATSKNAVAEKVTDRIIAALESGVAPWVKPWVSVGIPRNLRSDRPYRGINWLILSLQAMEKGYEYNLWLTYKQAAAIGGQVRKGETGTQIVFWKIIEKGEDDRVPLLRYYTVFNVAQIDGLDETLTAWQTNVDVDSIAAARDYISGVWGDSGNSRPAIVTTVGDKASYSPELDLIQMPGDAQFYSVAGYVGTLLHEAAHSTGHESRLNRWTGKQRAFGCADYAEEELIAEIGAAMIAARLGLPTAFDQHAAYVGTWLKRLKDDRSLLIRAAQAAQRAADWICGSEIVTDVEAEVAAV